MVKHKVKTGFQEYVFLVVGLNIFIFGLLGIIYGVNAFIVWGSPEWGVTGVDSRIGVLFIVGFSLITGWMLREQ